MSFSLKYYPITYKLKKSVGRKPWNLSLPFTSNWGKRKRRVLFVVDHVPTQDLEAGQLLSEINRPLFLNVLNQAFKIAGTWGCKKKQDDYAYGWVNFNFFKTYDMSPQQQANANKICVERLQLIIDKFKPTHIHFFGTTPFYLMYGEDVERRGWVFEKDGMMVSSNISVTRAGNATLEEEEDEEEDDDSDYQAGFLSVVEANMLGHASENLAKLIHGKDPFSLAYIKPAYTLIDKMAAWKKLYKRLWKSKLWAFDTETYNLSVTENGIALFQFSFDEKHSFIVPGKSVSSPWTADELREIFTDLRKLFSRKFDQTKWKVPVIIGQNLEFDFRMIRQELAIPVIYYRMWDTMIAEYCFHPSTMVKTESGPISITELVKMKNPPKVLSRNMVSGEDEYKPILLASKHANAKRMVKVNYSGGSVIVTEDHKIWSEDRKQYVEAGTLRPGEKVIVTPA